MDQDQPEPDRALLRKYRHRVALFLPGAVLLVTLLGTLYKAINTLQYLDLVETERDRWQRPEDVVAVLKLKQGNAVADLGSGAGYFALKLSRAVGKSGRVLAVDIRRLPLVFLWIRAVLGGQQNISVRLGGSDDPNLPAGALDAVLIANTYHEFANPEAMIDRAFRALRCGGHLVVLDRSQAVRGAASSPLFLNQRSDGADHSGRGSSGLGRGEGRGGLAPQPVRRVTVRNPPSFVHTS